MSDVERAELVERGEALEGGRDGVASGEGVAADDVDGHQVGPAAVAGDPRFAGVAGGVVTGSDSSSGTSPGWSGPGALK